ncbi:TIGR00730 family Rossman fold protein [Pseudogemmobacter humi]|uniref:Cytokinin riboside 5'-monophosphate phosphoribohydrolase n=1 Tax=Pseudogemmobacter humi TaxID=2483812 RepID=A0A3P5XK44_9RHOB|nr:TIGR00730 family Rossman fold protein [Pseudogemmobacter humi]VDC30559.1 LOG family protein YvdD [Pseudogemmobacter humi]
MQLPSICVFCGSRPGTNPAHAAAARAFGETIAREGWRLVYGAGDVGLMGEVARAAQGAGAPALGVIPVHLLGLEKGKRDLTTFVITEDMHERKKVMFMNSDAVVVLPGGAGSLDEFFEVLTWAQIGLHGKPIFLLDIGGYWRPLTALIDHVIAEGFAAPSLNDLFRSVDSVDELTAALRDYLAEGPQSRFIRPVPDQPRG